MDRRATALVANNNIELIIQLAEEIPEETSTIPAVMNVFATAANGARNRGLNTALCMK